MKKNKYNLYFWWKDEKIVLTILLFLIIIFQVCAFLKIPFLTSIHSYTVGMVFGFYNPFFYLYFFLKIIKNLFSKGRIKILILKINFRKYWILCISIICIFSTFFFYESKLGFTVFGTESWKAFNFWFNDFKEGPYWAPKNTNGGIMGALFFSVFSMIISGIGTFIVSIILSVICFSILLTGSSLGIYKKLKLIKKKNKKNLNFKNHYKKNIEFSGKVSEEIKLTKKIVNKSNEKKLELPFDDPFS